MAAWGFQICHFIISCTDNPHSLYHKMTSICKRVLMISPVKWKGGSRLGILSVMESMDTKFKCFQQLQYMRLVVTASLRWLGGTLHCVVEMGQFTNIAPTFHLITQIESGWQGGRAWFTWINKRMGSLWLPWISKQKEWLEVCPSNKVIATEVAMTMQTIGGATLPILLYNTWKDQYFLLGVTYISLVV